LDVRGESELKEEARVGPSGRRTGVGQDVFTRLCNLKGIGAKTAQAIIDAGFNTTEKISQLNLKNLLKIPGIGKKTAEKIEQQIKTLAKK